MTKQLTTKEFQQLMNVEQQAKRYAYNLKGEWWKSNKLWVYYRNKWEDLVNKLGVNYNGNYAKYTTECGKDYSHGYCFSDAIA